MYDGKANISSGDLTAIKELMHVFIFEVLGLKEESSQTDDMSKIMDLLISLRTEAKADKDYATSDKIRIALQEIGIQLKDSKEETSWSKL